MNTKPTSGDCSISSSLSPRTSVTNRISPAARSGRASTGRARRPPRNRVVSMQTPTFSMMSQTREISLLLMPRLTAEGAPSSAALHLALDHLALDVGDRLGRIEALRASLRAVHDGVAAVEPERVLEIVQPLACRLVAAVDQPALGLQQ